MQQTPTTYHCLDRNGAVALLRCRVVGMVGAAVQSSDGANEFGEGLRDPMPRIDVGGQFVMTTVEILDKGVSRADYSR